MCALTKGDLISAHEIERNSFSTPWGLATIESELLNPHAKLVGIKDQTRLIGWGAVRAVAGTGEITNIVIDEPKRGQGLSKVLLSAMLSELSQLGACEVFLEVRSKNTAAISLYKKNGFVPVSLRRGYYIKPLDDAIVMKREMRDFADTCP